MKSNTFTGTIGKLAIVASLLGVGSLMGVSAIAQEPTSPTQSPVTTPIPTEAPPGTQPGMTEPGTTTPGTQPGMTEPGTTEPGTTTPGTTEPGTTEPGTTTPGTTEPGTQPGMTEPGTTEPGTTTPGTQPGATSGNIVEMTAGNASFSTLAQAIEAAGLEQTLAGQGPYTVLAPTNEAFNELPQGAVEYLLRPENQGFLRQVLAYHVIPGNVPTSELPTGKVESLGGGLAVQVAGDNRVVVNNASVTQPDIQASNGVIHTVDRVLLSDRLQQTLAAELGVQEIY
ncbi:MAG: fasciclin domain-containing protein [Leptolyngbyaceae bacterium]|nr:fasciclin domain-containing protein [Leptolyngbyaceae bacterium]